MQMTVNVNDIRYAVQKLQVYVADSQNEFPYLNIFADENGGAICATDRNSFVEVRFDAEVTKTGSCLVGERFDKILINMSDDRAELNLTKSNLLVNGNNGFKARLAIVGGEDLPRQGIAEKIQSIPYALSATLLKSQLQSLIRLSDTFPAAEGMHVPTVKLTFENGEIVGATQESEIGAISAMPLAALVPTGEGSVELLYRTSMLKSLLSLCDNQAQIRVSLSPRDPLYISDPEHDNWWGMMSGIVKRGQNAS